MTNEMKKQLLYLYEQGKMDTEIAKELGVTDGAVFYWRKKLNLPTKFTYDKINKIDNAKFEQLFYAGLTDLEIAKQLNMSSDGIYSHRKRHGYIRRNYAENLAKPFNKFQKEVLIGTLMGDSSLALNGKNASLTCMHGIKQQAYCQHKEHIFKSVGAKGAQHTRNRIDKRTGIYYKDYTFRLPANPELNVWYNNFYIDGKKIIPFNLFQYFTAVSLAYLYMDDGSKTKGSYMIATNCFKLEELHQFQMFLKDKFNLDTTIQKHNQLYIRTSSRSLFEYLILPYIHPSMLYKIHNKVS